MKTRFILALAMLGAIVMAKGISNAGEHLPAPDGAEFWTFISKTDPYTGWGYWPGYYGTYPGRSPHGEHLKLYANGIALKAARAGKPMPYGAILVKENYGKDKKTLMAITPMYKVKGYNPEGGDWFWAKYDPNGKVLGAGKMKGCIQCHQARKYQDWLFTEAK